MASSTIAYEGTGFPLKPMGSGCSAFFGTGNWTGRRLNAQRRLFSAFCPLPFARNVSPEGLLHCNFLPPIWTVAPPPRLFVNDHPRPTSVHKLGLPCKLLIKAALSSLSHCCYEHKILATVASSFHGRFMIHINQWNALPMLALISTTKSLVAWLPFRAYGQCNEQMKMLLRS